MPIYPENSRRPGKILRRMVRILQRGGIQDWDEIGVGIGSPGLRTGRRGGGDGSGREDSFVGSGW